MENEENKELADKRSKDEKVESCVLQLKSQGFSKQSAFKICNSAIKGKKASEGDLMESVKLNEIEKQTAINDFSNIFKMTGLEDSDALKFSSVLLSKISKPRYETLSKTFKDDKNLKSYIGKTDASGNNGHTHNYTIMFVNFGEQLVGVTTSTSKGTSHAHMIDIELDNKITTMTAATNIEASDSGADDADYHRHMFSANLEEIRNTLPSIYVRNKYYSEDKAESDKADKKKKNFTEKLVYGEKEIGFSNQRQAEALISKVFQYSEKPEWFDGELDDLKLDVYNLVYDFYSDSMLFDDMEIAEFALNSDKIPDERKTRRFGVVRGVPDGTGPHGRGDGPGKGRGDGTGLETKNADKKVDPKAKVRNRPTAILPHNSSKVKDNKDHFPQQTASQARNALARVAQYKKVPSWFKGSLEELKKIVRNAVKKKYPTIKVTMSEMYALRFKDEGNAFFINCFTDREECAKDDAFIYRKDCPEYDIDLVKFTEEEGNTKFSELGSFVFFDSKSKGKIKSSGEIKLSEKDSQGNLKIEMLRTGHFTHPEYGQFRITSDMLNSIIKNFNDRVLDRDVSFDFNHEPDLPAAAWCKKLSLDRRDFKGNMQDVLIGYVKPTPRGEEAIKNGDYKYFSSEYDDNFVDKETNHDYGITLKGGGLTNRPWIPGLKPITLSEKRNQMGFIKS